MRKRRNGETLAEILMALLVFGIILGGVSDFIANQTTNVARIKTRDRILAQIPKATAYYYNFDKFPEPVSLDGVSFEAIDNSTLRAIYSTTSLDFALK